jgi:aminoglycoside phosphotransferase (APT) family kinase protein
MTVHQVDITHALVSQLITEQFPAWKSLPIKMVKSGGVDNRSFHLGHDMLIRLPSAEGYAAQVQKEQTWLPQLATSLSMQIPKPIAMGVPSIFYPWHWSIYTWISGQSANLIKIAPNDLEYISIQLAQFLRELRQIDLKDAPLAGPHNYYRGAHPSVYDMETKSAIAELEGTIDTDKAHAVWSEAISSSWSEPPVWIHGDFSAGNILIKESHLAAVIDFGCMGVGDPACDLVIAWTLLKGKGREFFKEQVALDADTWARARGWALWKALISLVSLGDSDSPESQAHQMVIDAVIQEYDYD